EDWIGQDRDPIDLHQDRTVPDPRREYSQVGPSLRIGTMRRRPQGPRALLIPTFPQVCCCARYPPRAPQGGSDHLLYRMRPPAFWLPVPSGIVVRPETHTNLVSRTAVWANAITPSACTRRCSTRIRRTWTRSAVWLPFRSKPTISIRRSNSTCV